MVSAASAPQRNGCKVISATRATHSILGGVLGITYRFGHRCVPIVLLSLAVRLHSKQRINNTPAATTTR